MRGLAAGVLLIVWCLPACALSPLPSYADAERAFSQLPIGDRLTFKVLLTTAGYWPAIADADFSRKLFDATTQYQADNGLPATGVVDKELLARLYRSGAPLLEMWGFRQIPHPYRGHPIWVPMGLGLLAERDKDGLTWRDPDKRVWVTYDFLRGVDLAAAYNSVVAKIMADGGQILFKMLRSDSFVVSSSTNGLDSYIRCQNDRPDVLWLSIFWLHKASDFHMERAATLMSGSFASAMTGAPFAGIPQLPPPSTEGIAALSRPLEPAPAAPQAWAQKESGEASGTGFFINPDGYVVTNAHVVENCAAIRVAEDQIVAAEADLVARDAANDLAVLKTTLKPEKVASVRSDVRLGEAVAAFGFALMPLAPDASNFTLGHVTALVGVNGDSRYLQISTPVPPGNSGGPLLDQNGAVVGVVSAKRSALNIMVATGGDVPQSVNFAIKGSLVASFLESNRIPFTEETASKEISGPKLAQQGRALSVSVSCR